MDLAVLCDFDGTIAEIDTAVVVFNKFINGNWRIFNEQLDRGEITLEQCMREQFSMIKAPKSVIVDAIDLNVAFRPGFKELVDYCKEAQIPFEIVSAGLDFVINHLLEVKQLSGTKVHAARTRYTDDGLEMDSLELHDRKSIDFKEDLVKHYKDKGYSVLYIGDGMSDKGAVTSADYVFVIKGARLADFCKTVGITHQEICDFHEVTASIKLMI
ncbi:HAD-IB family phosphatase [Candidatus Bathyarchaeota archaeon]|jgi:2-hydroxy-3-keto-5-methylthiopentenyl-1-phosphate phosphatase|nr:HAD-IB family phosphatase [Candidatus Bathyarchaeota archaeon]